ncbi:hypothetical protein JCM10207_007952 [Rhodosporidiobolus poonsookiae]
MDPVPPPPPRPRSPPSPSSSTSTSGAPSPDGRSSPSSGSGSGGSVKSGVSDGWKRKKDIVAIAGRKCSNSRPCDRADRKVSRSPPSGHYASASTSTSAAATARKPPAPARRPPLFATSSYPSVLAPPPPASLAFSSGSASAPTSATAPTACTTPAPQTVWPASYPSSPSLRHILHPFPAPPANGTATARFLSSNDALARPPESMLRMGRDGAADGELDGKKEDGMGGAAGPTERQESRVRSTLERLE